MTTTCPRCGCVHSVAPPTPPRSQPKGRPPRGMPVNLPPKPWTLQRALDFVAPFGRHRGRSLMEVSLDDPGYISWIVANVDPARSRNFWTAAKLLLDAMDRKEYPPDARRN